MASYNWIPLPRDYVQEQKIGKKPFKEVADHPLVPPKQEPLATLVDKTVKEKVDDPLDGGNKPAVDPLGAAAPAAAVDPLGAAADPLGAVDVDPLSSALNSIILGGGDNKTTNQNESSSKDDGMDTFIPWDAKKTSILHKYTTSDRLNITTSFLSSKEVPKVDKTKAKLEALEDDDDSVQTMLDLSQAEYVKHIDDLQQQLIKAWDADQKVKSLKIAIQNAKLLADTKVPQFYPSKFVLITEILDTFGRLVYDRILLKSTFVPGSLTPIPLPENFTPDQVSESAKETCRNWFFKIASIRELIPRLYVEMAILKCYKFLAKDEYPRALGRLSHMIRGVGDPLVATYCRAYLCRKGMEVAPNQKEHLLSSFYDFAFGYSQLNVDYVDNLLREYNLTYSGYLNLFTPAVDWILQCIAHQAPENTLETILEKYKTHCRSSLVLDSIISSFEPRYVSAHAIDFCGLIKQADTVAYPQHNLYHTLGVNLVLYAPPKEHQVSILKEVWAVVSKLEDPVEYMRCAEVYVEIPAKHLSAKYVNAMLGDIVEHITPNRAFENLQSQIQSITEKILIHLDFTEIFAMENFMPLLDMLQTNKDISTEVAKSMMTYFVRSSVESTNDPILINGMLFVAKTLHDSISATTFDDEKRQRGELIMGFIRKVQFGRDFEAQLNFYVQARASFANLDVVLQYLVQSACQLIMRTQKIVNYQHTRKTAAFVRATIGYCFITIPSIVSVPIRLSLYTVAGLVAMQNQCIPQAEELFGSIADVLVASSPKPENDFRVFGVANREEFERFLPSFLAHFCSILVVVPGSPEKGPFFLLKDFLNAFADYNWFGTDEKKYFAYLNVLQLLSCVRQEKLPYSIAGVEGNDVLYDGDLRYFAELDSISSTIFGQVVEYVGCSAASPNNQPTKVQSEIALQLLYLMVTLTSLEEPELLSLAFNLAKTAQVNIPVTHSLHRSTLQLINSVALNKPTSGVARLGSKLGA